MSANQLLLTPLQTMQQFRENMDVRKIDWNLKIANYIFDSHQPRMARISRLKSQVLKPTFLT